MTKSVEPNMRNSFLKLKTDSDFGLQTLGLQPDEDFRINRRRSSTNNRSRLWRTEDWNHQRAGRRRIIQELAAYQSQFSAFLILAASRAFHVNEFYYSQIGEIQKSWRILFLKNKIHSEKRRCSTSKCCSCKRWSSALS